VQEEQRLAGPGAVQGGGDLGHRRSLGGAD
jgi:hypothetical protein